MFSYTKHFESCLQTLRRENRYRIFRELAREAGNFPKAQYFAETGTREITIWCSNDYLGMGQHPSVLNAMHQCLDSYGAGAGGTRNISGSHHMICELERELAQVQQKEAGLVFSSGYVANHTALQTLGTILPDVVIFSDGSNHASMIEGMRGSKAEKRIFRHNDVDHLHELLKQERPNRPKLIAFESVYSMDGSFGPVAEILELAKKYNALTFIDETHAVGLYGEHGGGVVESLGLLDQVDILQGGLGKGFGVVGGFITGEASLIDVVRSYGAGFIFTTTIPPVVAAGALASVRHLRHSSQERQALFERVAQVRGVLTSAGLPLRETTSHILPLMVGDSAHCSRVSEMLLDEHDVYIQPINYPTVPKGTERLRITPTPLHTAADIEHLEKALSSIWAALELQVAA